MGNLEADSNVNLIFREKLIHSSPSSRVSTALTESSSGKTSKSGFRKIKSTKRHSSVVSTLPVSLDGLSSNRNDVVEKEDNEPEMINRIDVAASATDISSKLTNLMSGNNAFNANILIKNVNQEIVHRADPNLLSPASPSTPEVTESGKRKHKFTLKSPDRNH